MSELKAYRPRELVMQGRHNEPIYLKSEADKVIAEKDKEIQRLENLCESYRIDCDNLAIREANAYREIERDNKQLRHQKYKRCLAMAKLCHWKMGVFIYKKEKNDFYNRWHKRWLAIAEKFKTNSTINRKGGTNALQR